METNKRRLLAHPELESIIALRDLINAIEKLDKRRTQLLKCVMQGENIKREYSVKTAASSVWRMYKTDWRGSQSPTAQEAVFFLNHLLNTQEIAVDNQLSFKYLFEFTVFVLETICCGNTLRVTPAEWVLKLHSLFQVRENKSFTCFSESRNQTIQFTFKNNAWICDQYKSLQIMWNSYLHTFWEYMPQSEEATFRKYRHRLGADTYCYNARRAIEGYPFRPNLIFEKGRMKVDRKILFEDVLYPDELKLCIKARSHLSSSLPRELIYMVESFLLPGLHNLRSAASQTTQIE